MSNSVVSERLAFVDYWSLPDASDEALKGLECPICLADFETGEQLVAHDGKAAHIFHLSCISDWLKTKDKCPICRGKVSSVNGKSVQELRPSRPNTGVGIESLLDASAKGDARRVRSVLTVDSPAFWRGIALVQATQYSCPELAGEEGYFHIEEANHLAVIEAILESGSVPDKNLLAALNWGIFHKNRDMVQMLLRRASLSEHNRGTLVAEAVAARDLGTLRLLLQNGTITSKSRGESLICAAEDSLIEHVRELLDSGEISACHRIEAIEAVPLDSQVREELIALLHAHVGTI